MTDEPYRWLEAIANRREYIRDQLRGATPVFAFSRPEGVLLLGVGTGQSKVFEIYDRHGLAALGNPVDIEKVRQAAIEAAHVEGFSRAPEDVTARRILNFALSPLLKTSFEQIFSSPIVVELIFAEVGAAPAQDVLARVGFDGAHRFQSGGIMVAHTSAAAESAATAWLAGQLRPESSLREVAQAALAAWRSLVAVRSEPRGEGGPGFARQEGTPAGADFVAPTVDPPAPLEVADRVLELALLERRGDRRARYQVLDPQRLT